MITTYKATPLYGGALVCELPSNFDNISAIRQVPDNQEVFVDRNGFTSIIFDITERVGSTSDTGPEADASALKTHLEDIVDDDKDTLRVWNTTETKFSRLDSSIPAYTLIATTVSVGDRKKSSSAEPDFTALILTLLRLEKEKTDLLVTVSVPHMKGQYDEEEVDLELGKQGELIGDAVEYASKIWQTFKVKDWGLFDAV